MLDNITPIILTLNEAPNIGRTLEQLRWAQDIVVMDSYSDDDTLSIVEQFPQARIFQRKFDSLENQWNYALRETGIGTDWVLALDADYILTDELYNEISSLRPAAETAGYRVNFDYCIYGRALRGSAYPPVTVIYRRDKAHYRQDGHAHRVIVEGPVKQLVGRMLHDDWKPLSSWLRSQDSYMQLELHKLLSKDKSGLRLPDRIRKLRFVAPFFMLAFCLFAKRGILDGRPGLYYALQRMLAETLLSLYLINDDMTRDLAKQTDSKIPNAHTVMSGRGSDA
jgi:glycosyltransferase involved in cell wall biosynthesis